MAVVLEGFLLQETQVVGAGSFDSITATVTRYIAEDASIDVSLFVTSTFFSYERILTYNASTSTWSSQLRIGTDRLPYTYLLFLVRSSDFPNGDYNKREFDTSLAIGKYQCTVNSRNVNTYWVPNSTPLATPTGLYADNITSDSARVSWSAVENASGYKVEYRQSAGGGADLSLDRIVRLASNAPLEGRAC